MKHKFFQLCISILSLSAFASCHEIEQFDNDINGNFEQLWTIVDEHYCFFADKDIDWQSVHDAYAPRVDNVKSGSELFTFCALMLDELKDGHVNLSSSMQTSYYKGWWAPYPQNFNERIVLENYLGFNYKQLGPVTYGIVAGNVGYMRISSFASGLGQGNLDAIFRDFFLCDGLIIDVRDNGGGMLSNVENYVSRFIGEPTLVGYVSHKTGPGHNDFSEPFAYYYDPAPGARHYTRRVAVLTNRSTFSAANNFVSIMSNLSDIKIIGATTGGGCGIPMTYDLPCGWTVRLSACPVYDALMRLSESGVEPTEGFAVDITALDAANGHDTILDRAISYIRTGN